MEKKAASGTMLTLLLISMLMLAFSNRAAKAEPRTWTVDNDGPADFSRIQDAINAASLGDTIFVYNGTYHENVVVNKSISLVGENAGAVVIDGGRIGTAVTVQTNYVSISRFTIVNSGVEWQGSWWDSAILLNNSNNSILEQNNLTNNHCGIWLEGSNDNTISQNYISANSMRGIILVNSANNIMIENNITNNAEGISLQHSFHNSLRENVMLGNQYNFGIFGETLDHFIQDIDVSNSVNGKPIYYLINQSDLVIEPSTFPDIGYLGLVNSTNIIVKGLDVTHNVQGVLIAYSTDSEIKNNKLTHAVYGISLVSSAANTIAENDLTDNDYGVGLRYSLNNDLYRNNITKNVRGVLLYSANSNTITKNDIIANEFCGIDLTASTYNVMHGNNLTDSRYGMWADYSSYNSIYHNNFMNNTDQVGTSNSVNVWDDGYPSGGNYWSNYIIRYPDAKEKDDSGIWDTPYLVDTNNQDRYPLMEPWDNTPPITTDDYDGSWRNTDFNITLTATDNLRGVAETFYKINNEETTQNITFNGQPRITTEGANNKLEYWSADKVGNEELPHKILTGIKLDKTAPSGLIIVNNNASYTLSTSVTLTLTANDIASGVDKVRYSNDGTWDTEPWEPPATTKNWTLISSDGAKTVYYQLKDNMGFISHTYQDTIILDTKKPTANAGADQTATEGTTVTLNGSTSTDENGIEAYTWTFMDTTLQTLTGQNPTYTFATPGTYTITLKVTDPAGNTATDTTAVTVLAAETFPIWIIGAGIATIAVVAAAILLWRRKHQ